MSAAMVSPEGWEAVPQPTRARFVAAPVKLTLGPQRGSTRLVLTLDTATLEQLGWTKGDEMGLDVGRTGKVAGWLRFSFQAGGSPLRVVGRCAGLMVGFLAPPDMHGKTGPSEAAEHRVLGNVSQLLVRVPWSLDGGDST